MIRLAVAAPARERCGIADYARFLRQALDGCFDILPIDFPESERRGDWHRAAACADEAHIAHVHYEYSLFRTVKPYRNRFATFMRRLQPPSVVTLHDLLSKLEPKFRQATPRRAADLLRDLAYVPWFHRWEPYLYGLANHWLVHTEEHRQAVARIVGEESVSLHLHPVPETGRQWAPAAGPPTLLSPGFVKPHKGYLGFLDALQRLPAVSWTIAGSPQDARDGEFLSALRSQAARLGVTERMNVTGYLSRADLEQAASAAVLAVFPFDRVTGSGSLTWAIGLGMPIVAADLPSLRELTEAGAGLELLPRNNRDSWAERIGALVASPDRLEALAAANRSFSQRHRYDDLGQQLTPLFERLARRDHTSRNSA